MYLLLLFSSESDVIMLMLDTKSHQKSFVDFNRLMETAKESQGGAPDACSSPVSASSAVFFRGFLPCGVNCVRLKRRGKRRGSNALCATAFLAVFEPSKQEDPISSRFAQIVLWFFYRAQKVTGRQAQVLRSYLRCEHGNSRNSS